MSRVGELVVLSGIDVTENSLHSCMMNRKRMRRELREKRNSMGKVRTSTSNQIHEGSDHLLVQVLFVNGFGRVGFNQLTFRVDGSFNQSGFRETKTFKNFADEQFLGQSDCSLCLVDFDTNEPLELLLNRENEVSLEKLKQVIDFFVVPATVMSSTYKMSIILVVREMKMQGSKCIDTSPFSASTDDSLSYDSFALCLRPYSGLR